jgi:hypothetical protein
MNRRHGRIPPQIATIEPLAEGPAASLAAVVFMVTVVVCTVETLTVIAAGSPHVAGSLLATGLIVQLRAIVPVKPPDGVTVIVDVFPVMAPGESVIAVPAMEKLGGGLMVYVALATALCV